MFVINDLGDSIFDSSQDSCQEIFTSYSMGNKNPCHLKGNWYLEDGNGCSINSRKYSVIIQILEYSITHEEYIHQDNYRKKGCNDDLIKQNIQCRS